MADEISICNQAISECGGGEFGAPRITSFVDGTSLSTLCGELYPDTRDAVLMLHPWNFATAFARLNPQPVPSGDASEFKWVYMYQLPTQPYCLAVRGTDQGNGARFEIGTNGQGHRMLFSDEASVGIEYTKCVEDLGTWNPLALQVLIKMMASKLAKPVTGQNSTGQQKFQEALALLPEAKGSDGREGSPYRLRPNRTLVYARCVSGGGWRP
jgi:hypothetical protein